MIKKILFLFLVGVITLFTISIGAVYVENLEYEMPFVEPEISIASYDVLTFQELPEEYVAYLLRYVDEPEQEILRIQQEKGFLKVTYHVFNPGNDVLHTDYSTMVSYASSDSYSTEELMAEYENSLFNRYDLSPIIPPGLAAEVDKYISFPIECESVNIIIGETSEEIALK